jgi:predicted amidophosphoribosyltransferase
MISPYLRSAAGAVGLPGRMPACDTPGCNNPVEHWEDMVCPACDEFLAKITVTDARVLIAPPHTLEMMPLWFWLFTSAALVVALGVGLAILW